jgi:hypothetical protein
MALDSRDLFVVQRTFGADADKLFKTTAESIAEFIAATPAVHYMGQRDFTDSTKTPAAPQDGDLWVNGQKNPGRFAWTPDHLPKDPDDGTSSLPVTYFDKCIWNADAGLWDVFTGNDSEGTLTEITAQYPLDVDSATDPAKPDITIKAAKETDGTAVSAEEPSGANAGVVEAIAVDTDVAPNVGTDSPNPYAVVPAHLLKATNEALASATAGGVADVVGVNPKDANIPSIWKTNADTTTYDTPAAQVYKVATTGGPEDPDGTVRDVYVQFATESQVGVSYTAPAAAGAVITFTNALENDSSTMDNFGMMTTRRTFVNFVPRDFEILNELP